MNEYIANIEEEDIIVTKAIINSMKKLKTYDLYKYLESWDEKFTNRSNPNIQSKLTSGRKTMINILNKAIESLRKKRNNSPEIKAFLARDNFSKKTEDILNKEKQ